MPYTTDQEGPETPGWASFSAKNQLNHKKEWNWVGCSDVNEPCTFLWQEELCEPERVGAFQEDGWCTELSPALQILPPDQRVVCYVLCFPRCQLPPWPHPNRATLHIRHFVVVIWRNLFPLQMKSTVISNWRNVLPLSDYFILLVHGARRSTLPLHCTE